MDYRGAPSHGSFSTRETILLPSAVKAFPSNQLVDFHFACKIPSNLEHLTDNITAYLLKVFSNHIEYAYHKSSKASSTELPQARKIPAQIPLQSSMHSWTLITTKTYSCTFPRCNATFESMAPWKRHEQDIHDPQKQWKCPEPLCEKTYSRKNKFERHHEKAHGCTNCTHSATAAGDLLPRKTAWGCGFCVTVFQTWEARCAHVASHFEAVPRACKSRWSQRTVMEGLLLQPRLVELRDWLVEEAESLSEFGVGGGSDIGCRAPDGISRDLQSLDEQRDLPGLVKEALVYLGLYSGTSTRVPSPPPPSMIYLDSEDGSTGYGPSGADAFGNMLGDKMVVVSAYEGPKLGAFCQEQLFDDPNEDFGLGQYGYYTSVDDALLEAPSFTVD